MTNEEVAKALGYALEEHPDFKQLGIVWCKQNAESPNKPFYEILPGWTTSLDAIVGEIERRKFVWSIWKDANDTYSAGIKKQKKAQRIWASEWSGRDQPTAPLALCKALISYLEENNDTE